MIKIEKQAKELNERIDRVSQMFESSGLKIEQNGKLLTVKEFLEPSLALLIDAKKEGFVTKEEVSNHLWGLKDIIYESVVEESDIKEIEKILGL